MAINNPRSRRAVAGAVAGLWHAGLVGHDPEGVIVDGPHVRVGRACAAVVRDGIFGPEVLMVRHRDFWTLPGGGIEPGEDSSAAAVRELREEAGLEGTAVRELFPRCWLIRVDRGSQISIGTDPELESSEQVLRGVAWFTLDEKFDDRQVSQVIRAIGASSSGSGVGEVQHPMPKSSESEERIPPVDCGESASTLSADVGDVDATPIILS